MTDAVVDTLNANQLHPVLALAYSAAAQLHAGQAARCLEILARIAGAPPQRSSIAAKLRPLVARLKAEALEKLGRYRDAYAAYTELNGIERGAGTSLDDWPRMVTESAALDVPHLEHDSLANHFVMTGFARSGTTLLENALAAHSQIETFEEIPSRASMQIYLERTLPEAATPALRKATFLEARRRFYDEAIRRSRKAGATVFIDKAPMRAADAGFMVKLFPEKHYIFSIRHPFDVVLSCFKQNFKRNSAMEHFRSFDTAVKLYDFTMTQWFGVFSMDDPRVHYVRYDTLVSEFEPTMRGVLGFLGAEWDDAVLDFASAAEKRSNKTPSYQKVRQGLSIGVQTSWRNYDFLFQTPDAKPLHKWAEFFGYPTK